ncbi:MAG TPA: ABC transporter ATP-binding protein [Candidatus Paceibacterota bacterium]|nr:ABC transporter ATP-binding protein [Candidatus Paceibacterota bacterium]
MIEISHLKKFYSKRLIIDDLSFAVKTGSVFGFLGQNGAGKTTTIKMMTGIAAPDSGTITIGGKDSADIAMRETIGFMPEAPYFYDRLTGLEFLRFCGALFPRHKSDEAYAQILKDIGIYDARNRSINTYSKGMKQRLGFAQALVNDPDYIFLDEPLDGLDPLGRREIKKIILGLKTAGKTVFFNSHILYDTEEICDEIGLIHDGKLLYAGGVKEFCKGVPLEQRFVETVEEEARKPVSP